MCGGGGGAQVEQPGPYETKLVELSEKRLAEYDELYKPIENQRMAEAKAANSPGKKRLYTDEVAGATKLQTATGVNAITPVDGGKLALSESANMSNQATGIASAMGSQVAEDDYSNRMLQMVGLGRKQAGTSVSTTGAAASREVATAVASHHAQSYVDSARLGMYGTIAGAGAGWASNKFNLLG